MAAGRDNKPVVLYSKDKLKSINIKFDSYRKSTKSLNEYSSIKILNKIDTTPKIGSLDIETAIIDNNNIPIAIGYEVFKNNLRIGLNVVKEEIITKTYLIQDYIDNSNVRIDYRKISLELLIECLKDMLIN